ncbi:unnamed protein product [marine sediment metagenome]|uniref:Uncharacterized protein n=1 Tax=marine sediment metagenome TaxID=412755 RepID=X0T2P5_9ZZZZ
MTEIFKLSQIKEALKNIDPIHAVEEGFLAYSQGKVVVLLLERWFLSALLERST